MSTPCYYCELDPGSCELCIHEVNIEDLRQQAHREGWEQAKMKAVIALGGCNTVEECWDAIAAMEYRGEK